MSLVNPEEALALGIGDASTLHSKQLRAFCRIVAPVETACGPGAHLRQRAQDYAREANIENFVRNAVHMSRDVPPGAVDPRFLTFVRERQAQYEREIKELEREMREVDGRIKQFATLPLLSPETRQRFANCTQTSAPTSSVRSSLMSSLSSRKTLGAAAALSVGTLGALGALAAARKPKSEEVKLKTPEEEAISKAEEVITQQAEREPERKAEEEHAFQEKQAEAMRRVEEEQAKEATRRVEEEQALQARQAEEQQALKTKSAKEEEAARKSKEEEAARKAEEEEVARKAKEEATRKSKEEEARKAEEKKAKEEQLNLAVSEVNAIFDEGTKLLASAKDSLFVNDNVLRDNEQTRLAEWRTKADQASQYLETAIENARGLDETNETLQKAKAKSKEVLEQTERVKEREKQLTEFKKCGALVDAFRAAKEKAQNLIQEFQMLQSRRATFSRELQDEITETKLPDLEVREQECRLLVKEGEEAQDKNLLNTIKQRLFFIQEDTNEVVNNIAPVYMVVQKLNNWLQNFAMARVRVYLRLNRYARGVASPTDITGLKLVQDNSVEYTRLNSKQTVKVGPFKAVLSADTKENDLYTAGSEPIQLAFQQLLEGGYSTVLFGYGFSGSGKSRSLFGGGDAQGIVPIGLEDIQKQASVTLVAAFELYGTVYFQHSLPSNVAIQPRLRIFFADAQFEDGLKKVVKIPIVEQELKTLAVDTPVREVVRILLEAQRTYDLPLTKALTQTTSTRTIKPTPNNEESSRAHLFIVFKIQKAGVKPSFLTVVDMAGVENPLAIATTFFNEAENCAPFHVVVPLLVPNIGKAHIGRCLLENPQFWNAETWKPSGLTMPTETDTRVAFVLQLIREGFFINETINHLTAFLDKRCGKSRTWETLAQRSRNTGFGLYRPELVLLSPNESTNHTKVGIQPIMEFLAGLAGNDASRPSKFLVLVLLQTAVEAYEQRAGPGQDATVLQTLSYAEQVLCNQAPPVK